MIAVPGDPLAEVDALKNVQFVMKDDLVFKKDGAGGSTEHRVLTPRRDDGIVVIGGQALKEVCNEICTGAGRSAGANR